MKIAEVVSRFDDLEDFIGKVCKVGFKFLSKVSGMSFYPINSSVYNDTRVARTSVRNRKDIRSARVARNAKNTGCPQKTPDILLTIPGVQKKTFDCLI